MQSYQNDLEDAVNKMSEDELKETLMDIAVSVSGSGRDKEKCHDAIVDVINKRILSRN